MPNYRAQYWMAVTILLIAGLVVEQKAAVMVAAMVGVCIAALIDHIVFGRPRANAMQARRG
jgi:hypothetical protein